MEKPGGENSIMLRIFSRSEKTIKFSLLRKVDIKRTHMVFIYTTCSDEARARELAGKMVSDKLAVCVNIWRIGSIYRWEGELREEKEVAILIQTNESKVQQIEDCVLQNHAYSVPFAGVVDIRRVNREYKEWMSEIIH